MAPPPHAHVLRPPDPAVAPPPSASNPCNPDSRAACRLGTSIPHPRIITHNVTSLTAYPVGPASRDRMFRVENHVRKMLKNNDIVLLQETQLKFLDRLTLERVYKNCLAFCSNPRAGEKGGVAILIKRDFASGYEISTVNHGEIGQGRVLTVHLRSLLFPLVTRASFMVSNVYLQSGGGHGPRLKQAFTLKALGNRIPLFLGGDFNMTENPGDSPSTNSYLTLVDGFKLQWDDFLVGMGLSEVEQDRHTHFYALNNSTSWRTSRIDRIYCSLNEGEKAVVLPHAFVYTTCGAEVVQAFRKGGGGVIGGAQDTVPGGPGKLISAHIPVCLSFTSSAPSKRRAFSCPKWVAKTEGFSAKVSQHWVKDLDPFVSLGNWKKAVTNTTKSFFANQKAEAASVSGDLGLVTRIIALVRAASSLKPDLDQITSLERRYPDIKGLVSRRADGSFDSSNATRKLGTLSDDHIKKAGLDMEYDDPLPPPPAYFPGDDRSEDPVSRLKDLLPSSRSRLTHIKEGPGGSLTNDPHQMGAIISKYYTSVWKKDFDLASPTEVDSYLRIFTDKVPAHLQPKRPGYHDFIDAINSSNDSCPGPDGIPFAVLREYVKLDPDLAKTLCRIALSLGHGDLPGKGWNWANLHLIEKKSGGDVADTRCISVTDSVNRISASVVVKLITPALASLIHLDQKGFMTERVGTEHIDGLLQGYYSKLSVKQQHYVLLLDQKRAFDSLDHSFIVKVLVRVGFDQWIINMVLGMLHEVWVFPVLSTGTKHRIPIRRGVKQGCPLSPLLFVLAFEALLRTIRKDTSVTQRAYADDLAISTDSFADLLRAMGRAKAFRRVSGLEINVTKTTLVTTMVVTEKIKRILEYNGWVGLELAAEGTYLGIRFGARTNTDDMFEGVFNKFTARKDKYIKTLARCSVANRTLIWNVWITSLFGYVGQFAIIPFPMLKKIRLITLKLVVPFGGTAWGYAHTITPKGKGFSLARPLRDLWAWNYTLLAAPFPLEDSHGALTPVMGDFAGIVRYGALDNSSAPRDHSAFAAFALLEDSSPRLHGVSIDLGGLPPANKPAERRRWIYDRLVTHYPDYDAARTGPTIETALPTKIGKALGPEGRKAPDVKAANQTRANAALVRPKVSEACWDNFFRLCMNALPFSKRLEKAKMRGDTEDCYFCGAEKMDSLWHVFGECEVVNLSRESAAEAIGVSTVGGMARAIMGDKPLSVAEGIFVCAFNYAVWWNRTHFLAFMNPDDRHEGGGIVARLVDSTVAGIPLKGTTKAGERAVRGVASAPPLGVLCGYSDGSALGSPGPTGGGYTITLDGRTIGSGSFSLGEGDNNLGEMGALLGLIRRITKLVRGMSTRPKAVYLFSDSAGCIGYLEKGWSSPKWVPTSRDARNALFELRKTVKRVVLFWIRGHCGIPGNEAADKAAREGAELAKKEMEEGLPSSGLLGDTWTLCSDTPPTHSNTHPALVQLCATLIASPSSHHVPPSSTCRVPQSTPFVTPHHAKDVQRGTGFRPG